jgi:hypothetical protein
LEQQQGQRSSLERPLQCRAAVARRQQRRYAGEAAAYMEQQAAAMERGVEQTAAPVPPAGSDYAAELEQLAQLKTQGIISEEEFEAKKKQILGI